MLKAVAGHTIKSLVRKKAELEKNFLNWEQIQSIALLIEEEEKLSKHRMDLLVDAFQKPCEVFYIELKAKVPSYNDWHCLTSKHKNLLGLPKKSILQSLQSKKFDLIINTAANSIFYSAALSSSLHATCTCSSSEQFGHSDLIVHRQANQSLEDYLQNVLHYLRMINSAPTT